MSDKNTSHVAAPESQAQPQTQEHKEDAAKLQPALDEAKLQAATNDLYYPSESDEPVKPVSWPVKAEAVTVEQVRQQAGVDTAAPVKEISTDQFFERVLKTEDWYGDEEKAVVQQFTELKKLLEDNLHDLKVFRFGEVEIDVYVIGLDKAGNLAGVATKIVET